VRRRATLGDDIRTLDRLGAILLDEAGAEATPVREYDFPGQLCISVSGEAVHGIPGSRILQDGDLVQLDLAADRCGFVADATRVVALPPVDAETSHLAECAIVACRTAIRETRPGMALAALGGVIQEVVTGYRVFRYPRPLRPWRRPATSRTAGSAEFRRKRQQRQI
jgi:methionyl aminopeptidase